MAKKLTAEQKAQLTRKSTQTSWRERIVKHLTENKCENNGSTDLEVYNATRPDRLELSDSKKIKNIASQLTYLRDDGYFLTHNDKKIVVIANPKEEIYEGADKWLD